MLLFLNNRNFIVQYLLIDDRIRDNLQSHE